MIIRKNFIASWKITEDNLKTRKNRREPGKEDKQMYIPEFWCGVVATIIVEVAILVIMAVWPSRKSKKR